jgi:flagellar assembly factor FliW
MSTQPDLNLLFGQESPPLQFPSGLIGFEEWKRFALITHPQGEPLRLLQSLDDERITFIVADPRQIVSDYRFSLSEADVRSLGSHSGPLGSPGQTSAMAHHPEAMSQPDTMDVYCILSVQEDPFGVTANLLGPLVVNWQTGLGIQVILSESGYAARHPVISQMPGSPLQEEGSEGKKEGE